MSVKFECSLTFAPIKTPVKIFSANEGKGCHTFSMEGIFEHIVGDLLTKEKDTNDSPFKNQTVCPLCRGNIFLLKIDEKILKEMEEMNKSSIQSNSPRENTFTKDENKKKLFKKFVETFAINKQITIEDMKIIRDEFLKKEFIPENNEDANLNKKIFLYLSLIIIAAFVISFVNIAIYHIFFRSVNYG